MNRLQHRLIDIAVILAVQFLGLSIANADAGTRDRVVLTHCGLHAEKARVAGAAADSVISAIIGNTLGRLGAALRAAGEERTIPTVIARNFVMEPDQPAKCVVIARGRWSSQLGKENRWKDRSGKPLVFKIGRSQPKEYLAVEPDFLTILELDMAGDRSALRLVPKLVEYRRRLEDGGSGRRAISIELAFHDPGKLASDSGAISANIVLGDLETGRRYHLDTGIVELWKKARRSASPDWHPDDDKIQFSAQEESNWFPSYAPKAAVESSGGKPVPKILTLTVAETRAARPMLLFLADVFDDSQEGLQGALELKLLKSKREEAEAAAAKAKYDQMVQLVDAIADADIAIASYCKLLDAGETDPIKLLNASKSTFKTMSSANFLASGLSQPVPYPVVPRPKGEAIPQLCS